MPYLRSVLSDDGLQDGLSCMTAPGICVPVSCKLKALLELLGG